MSGIIGVSPDMRSGAVGVWPPAPTGFNVGGHLIGMKYASDNAEYEPADTSWHTIVSISHSAQNTTNTIFCIGTMPIYTNTSSKGQINISCSGGTSIYASGTGTDSIYTVTAVAGLNTWYGAFKPGSTRSLSYNFQMAEEGGSDFRANVSDAATTILWLYELSGTS